MYDSIHTKQIIIYVMYVIYNISPSGLPTTRCVHAYIIYIYLFKKLDFVATIYKSYYKYASI